MSLQRQDVDRLLAPEFVEGLRDASVDEIRARRADCRRVEDLMSYLRRVVQGQIDLVGAEVEMRGSGRPARQHSLVEDLPSILSGTGTGSGNLGTPAGGSVPAASEIFAEEGEMTPEEIAAAISPNLLAVAFKGGTLPGANLDQFADNELAQLAIVLREYEATLSAERHVLHERIDTLQALVVERYKSGAARADTLLEGELEATGSKDGIH